MLPAGAVPGGDTGNGTFALLLICVLIFVADHVLHLPVAQVRFALRFTAPPCRMVTSLGYSCFPTRS